MKKGRERSKSLGHILLHSNEHKQDPKGKDGNDIRSLCYKVAPYITHQWREVCEELGVTEKKLDRLYEDYSAVKRSELAFQGLSLWIETAGRFATTDRLLRAVRSYGLHRAEGELKCTDDHKELPCFAKPSMVDSHGRDQSFNKHAKQRAVADRLSRPKSRYSENSETSSKSTQSQQAKRRPSFIADSVNPLLLLSAPTKQSALCEFKVKINIQGVQRKGTEAVESTKDDISSTKYDFKHVCHSFLRLVMANKQTHFNQLKDRLGFQGIAVMGLDKVGFNINLHIVCFNLGALETLVKSYESKRLRLIVQSCLVTDQYLNKLGVANLELSVSIEDRLINKNREVIVAHSSTNELKEHPIDSVSMCKYLMDDNETQDDRFEVKPEMISSFDIKVWHTQLQNDIDAINSRLRQFLLTVNNFLLTIRILRPVEKKAVQCLEDIIECLHHIKSTKHLQEGVHSDVIEEYLAIVNQVRLKVADVHQYEIVITFDDVMNDVRNELFQTHLKAIDRMLEPDFDFQQIINEMGSFQSGFSVQTLLTDLSKDEGNTILLSSSEIEVYGGCLCYIPSLIRKLSKLSGVIDNALIKEDETERTPRKPSVLGNSVTDIQKSPVSLNFNENRSQQLVTL